MAPTFLLLFHQNPLESLHASCVNLGSVELQKIESGNDSWYCSNCKAECSLCSGAVLNSHKAVQCDKCEMWVHNNCSFMSDSEYETMQNSNCTWICPKCDFFNFSDSFFNEQFNLESENRFDLLARGHENKSTETLNSKNSFISGLKFSSININSIRGKKLELLAFIDFHQSQILAIQETKIDNSILTSELFPESFPYSVYRKDRTLHGGGVMLLVHKDIPHMPLTELDNDSESVWVKLFVNKKTHFVASWYRPPVDGHLPVSDNGNDLLNSLEKFDNLFREQLDKIKNINKGNKPPLIHVLGDFNFRDIVWPDRLSKSGSSLSQTEGQILIDIMNDHGLEQLVNFPTRERNTLDLILTSLPGQFVDIHSPDKLSDHDIVSGTLKIAIPPIKKPRRKVYRYQKGDYESMRAETLKFAKERYFNGYSDTRSVQENFNLITSFIQESADKHIPSKTSRSVSSVPWITPEIRRRDPHTHGLQEELEKVQNRAARFVTGNYVFETGSMTGILGQLKWESLKKRRKDSRLILLYKGLKGKARIPTDDLIPKNRRCRNQHSLAFQIPSASKEAYKSSFFPQTIRDWNDLPDSLVSSAEMSDDCVSKFASLVRSRD